MCQNFEDPKFDFQKQPPDVFREKGVLRNFATFTGKHLCQSLFFNKVADLRPKNTSGGCFRCFRVSF